MPQPNSALAIVRTKYPDVESVIDGEKNTAIEVTAADCKFAKKKDYQQCAMARACQRAMHLDGVIAMRATIYLVKGDTAIRFILPESVRKEITSFDRGAYFAPGLYELKKPWGTNTLKYKAVQKQHIKKNKGTGRKKAKVRHYTTGIRAIL